MSVNRVILVGVLGRDPEFRTFQNGTTICNLSLATGERWKDRQTGEMREKTEWHRVVVYPEGLVNLCRRLVKKNKIYVEGQIETRKWKNQAGAEQSVVEVAVRGFKGALEAVTPPSAPQSPAPPPPDPSRASSYQTYGQQQEFHAPVAESPTPYHNPYPEMDDDIPF